MKIKEDSYLATLLELLLIKKAPHISKVEQMACSALFYAGIIAITGGIYFVIFT